jgi:hypothetical protein
MIWINWRLPGREGDKMICRFKKIRGNLSGAMLLNNITPHKDLADFIRFYRIIDFDFTGSPEHGIPSKAYRPRIEHCLQFTPFDQETVDYPNRSNTSWEVALFGQPTFLT